MLNFDAQFSPSREAANLFVLTLTGDKATPLLFQALPDNKNLKIPPKSILGSMDDVYEQLVAWNAAGYGIFVTVNKTTESRRTSKDIVGVRAYFVDKDDGDLRNHVLQPTIEVRTKQGMHGYWVLRELGDTANFQAIQKILIHHYRSDKSVKDLPRLMRLPGFFHLKVPEEPVMVNVVSSSDAKYSLEEISHAYSEKSAPRIDDTGPEAKKLDIVRLFKDKALYLYEISPGMHAVKCPWSSDHSSNNNDTATAIFDGSGIDGKVGFKCFHSHCSHRTLRTVIEYFGDEAAKFIDPSRGILPADVADALLAQLNLKSAGRSRLKYWQGQFYRYTGDRYELYPSHELRAAVIAYLRNRDSETRKRATPHFAGQVIANLEAICVLPSTITPPVFFSYSGDPSQRFIALRNTILSVPERWGRSEQQLRLIPKTEDYFSFSCLPFEYIPEVESQLWQKFLDEMLPDQETQSLLQEWFGYNLVYDTSQQKFMIFVGQGANGKSVVCSALKALVGVDNVSALGIEAFDGNRTFPIAAMTGKLANISEEISSTDQVAEGILKGLTSGALLRLNVNESMHLR
jgi:putative DNA primase/helicase